MKLLIPVLFACVSLLVLIGCDETPPETVALAQLTMKIEAGTALSTEHVEVREVLVDEVPEGALRGVDVAYYLGRVVAEDRDAGQLLARHDFARPEPQQPQEPPPPPPPREIDHQWCEAKQEELTVAIEALDRSCEKHQDCVLYRPSCPFGCGEAVNARASRAEIQREIRAFRGECELCRTECPPPGFPVCEEGQCTFSDQNLRAEEARLEEEMIMLMLREHLGASDDPMAQEMLEQLMGGDGPIF